MILDALASEFRNELAITNDPFTGLDLDAELLQNDPSGFAVGFAVIVNHHHFHPGIL